MIKHNGIPKQCFPQTKAEWTWIINEVYSEGRRWGTPTGVPGWLWPLLCSSCWFHKMSVSTDHRVRDGLPFTPISRQSPILECGHWSGHTYLTSAQPILITPYQDLQTTKVLIWTQTRPLQLFNKQCESLWKPRLRAAPIALFDFLQIWETRKHFDNIGSRC